MRDLSRNYEIWGLHRYTSNRLNISMDDEDMFIGERKIINISLFTRMVMYATIEDNSKVEF
ncbi:hypothetical protein KSF_025310 [Reticulibacter mediterranei]|uniref:Uncharacterized protein n=1 Tax=Reticulibacter mediterranei TaxID=2778369 RepID=A0A8J3N1D4_9CHLR|nr:hypothetical protein KSF_025310 [Reticulibacter mediterranei]